MKTIINNKENLYIILKSKFISLAYKVNSVEEINTILKEMQEKYFDATHICYAYILPNTQKYNDDNEPKGTAGLPILEVLTKNNLCNVLVIVIRYFGGIKLGAGGLFRAYTKASSLVITDNIKDIEEGYQIKIKTDYKKLDSILFLLENSKILAKDFHDDIIIEAIVNKKTLDQLSNVSYELINKTIY